MAALRPAAFLDRDGTLNWPAQPGRYICDPADLHLFAGAADAVKRLRQHGYACVVVSNQRGVSLGHLTEDRLKEVDSRLRELVPLDGSYYCTHGLETGCACRKPRPGLLVRAADELGLDLARSVMIGDSQTDLDAGHRAGCRVVKVAPANGALLDAACGITASPAEKSSITSSGGTE